MDLIVDNWQYLLDGVKITLALAVLSALGGMTMGLTAAIIRIRGGRVSNAIVTLYIDFFRSTPVVLQLIWIYFALPVLAEKSISPFIAAAVALSLYEGSFFTEIFRAGLLGVPRGQRLAASALGMRSHQVYRRVIIPQAFTTMLPVVASQWVLGLKNTAIVSVIQVGDLTHHSLVLGQGSLQPLTALTAALVIYVILTYPLTVASNLLHTRLSRPS